MFPALRKYMSLQTQQTQWTSNEKKKRKRKTQGDSH